MSKIWVLVADKAGALILSTDKLKKSLTVEEKIDYIPGELKNQDLVSDKPGISYDSQGQGRHAIGNADTASEHSATIFAREISAYLLKKLQSNAYWKLVIIADPHFLGLLRKHLDANVLAVVSLEIDKNLTNLPVDGIHKHLLRYL